MLPARVKAKHTKMHKNNHNKELSILNISNDDVENPTLGQKKYLLALFIKWLPNNLKVFMQWSLEKIIHKN